MWAAIVLAGAVIAFVNPVDRIEVEQTILRSSCILAMLVCVELWKIETSEGKAITINLATVFACTGILLFLTETDSIVIFTNAPFAGFYLNQYGNAIYNLSLLFFCMFLAVHTLTRSGVLKKYLIAGTLSMAVGVLFYYPIIENPQYAYTVPEVLDFKSIETVQRELGERGLFESKAELIAKRINLPKWQGFKRIRDLTYEESLVRVQQILPYTRGTNYVNLINEPLRAIALKMNLVAVSLLALLTLVGLLKDPPRGAYIDKLEIAFFVYLVFETIHGYVIQDIIEWDVFLRIDGIGKLVTTLLVLLLAFVEFRRFRFLSAGFGRYYESALIRNPRSITRWRDGLDNMVLGQFFKSKSIIRRFFQVTQDDSAINRKNSEKTLDKET